MSEALLEQLNQQRAQFIQQRDFAQNNLNQLIGAIYACDMMIEKHQKSINSSSELAGEQGNVEANNEGQESNT
jgi:hypothetical protein